MHLFYKQGDCHLTVTKAHMSVENLWATKWWVKAEMEPQAKHLGDQYCIEYHYNNVYIAILHIYIS